MMTKMKNKFHRYSIVDLKSTYFINSLGMGVYSVLFIFLSKNNLKINIKTVDKRTSDIGIF